jgi:hypothetical protein
LETKHSRLEDAIQCLQEDLVVKRQIAVEANERKASELAHDSTARLQAVLSCYESIEGLTSNVTMQSERFMDRDQAAVAAYVSLTTRSTAEREQVIQSLQTAAGQALQVLQHLLQQFPLCFGPKASAYTPYKTLLQRMHVAKVALSAAVNCLTDMSQF